MPQPLKKTAGDPVSTSATDTSDSSQAGFAPAHAHIGTSWERACSVSLEQERQMLSCTRLQLSRSVTPGNDCSLSHILHPCFWLMDSPEMSISLKKHACPNLSSMNRMGHGFSKDLLARENTAPLKFTAPFKFAGQSTLLVLERNIYQQTDTAENQGLSSPCPLNIT